MNILRAKTVIHCDTCGVAMKRMKTFKVAAKTKDEATKEVNAKIELWQKGLKGKNCRVCAAIIKDIRGNL